jgi:hypothetical protein
VHNKRLAEVARLLFRVYLRAAELEIAAEEPLRSDLDAKGLKAQVLGRIEELEARERERGAVRVRAGDRGARPRHGSREGGDGRIRLSSYYGPLEPSRNRRGPLQRREIAGASAKRYVS